MIKKPNIKISILLITIIFIFGYLFINSIIINNKSSFFKSLFSNNQKQFILKYIFPYKLIHKQEQKILEQEKQLHDVGKFITMAELYEKEKGSEIVIKKSEILLSNNKILKKYLLTSGFYSGIANEFPGTGYIDFYDNNIVILSSRGLLAYRKNLDDDGYNFKQIKNNINEFISMNEFIKRNSFSIKDILILNNKIFISYTEQIKVDCWNTSIIYGEMNFVDIKFKKFFSPKECIDSNYNLANSNNIDKEFEASQSGGRIISFDDKNILLSIGDYRSRHLAQNKQSVNGKIIKINVNNNKYEIISMGHRNPQGLYFDKENNFLLETEHGPMGGDEINLIELTKINKNKIYNYGWPMVSEGEHYGGRSEKNKKKYEKYPLYKSHSKHGFLEPLMSFVPSIGISEIVKIDESNYIASSMRDKSLYFFQINEKKKIVNLDRVEVGERVRDLRFNNNQLFLFMEDTPSIGEINLN